MLRALIVSILPLLFIVACKKDNDAFDNQQIECRTSYMAGVETVDITYSDDDKVATLHIVGDQDRLYDLMYLGDTTVTLLGNDTASIIVFNEHGLPVWARDGNYLIELTYTATAELQGMLVTVLANGLYRGHWEVKDVQYQYGDIVAYTVVTESVSNAPTSDNIIASYDTSMSRVNYDPTDVYQTFGFMMFARHAWFLSPQMFSKHMLRSWVPSHMGGLEERTYSYDLDENGNVLQVVTDFTETFMDNDTLTLGLECL